jgi:hypothetical protein
VSHFVATALTFQGSYRLVGERTRIVDRMKATLARLDVRNFKPTLRKAAERLATVHTPEGRAEHIPMWPLRRVSLPKLSRVLPGGNRASAR